MTDTIHLVIASQGEYSDRVEWIVGAFRTEAEAIDCANQRNITVLDQRAADREYSRAAHWIRMVRAAEIIGPGWDAMGNDVSVRYNLHIKPEHRQTIEREVVDRLGEHPAFLYDDWADDHVVVSVPIGEIGRWDIR